MVNVFKGVYALHGEMELDSNAPDEDCKCEQAHV